MNQKSLSVLTLIAPAVAITTSTNHTAVDLAPYASVGRREMKAHFGAVCVSGTTSIGIKIQDNPTTSASGDAGWADITGAAITALTTQGYATAIHIATAKRYIRAVTTLAGTTISAQPFGIVLVENRSTVS